MGLKEPSTAEEETEAGHEGGTSTQPHLAAPGFEPPAPVGASRAELAGAPALPVVLETARARARIASHLLLTPLLLFFFF